VVALERWEQLFAESQEYHPAVCRIAIPALVVAGATVFAAVGLAAQSPKARLAAMRRSVAAERSVHYLDMSTWPNHTDRVVADVGPRKGTWTETTDSRGVRGWASGIVTKQSGDARASAYLRANAYTLHTEFYLSKRKAARFAGKWIALAPENGPYPGVFSEVTFGQLVSNLFPHRKLALVRAGSLLGVRGTQRPPSHGAFETLFAPAHGKALPTEETFQASRPSAYKDRRTFSRWNEPIHAKAPAHALTYCQVFGC
jgi:hypothetical protein